MCVFVNYFTSGLGQDGKLNRVHASQLVAETAPHVCMDNYCHGIKYKGGLARQ